MHDASSGPGADGTPRIDDAQVGRIFREASGRSVATLIRVLGDIDLAEDAVQEAFALALRRWPGDGLPPSSLTERDDSHMSQPPLTHECQVLADRG